MSVSLQFTLPAQATTGRVKYIPLGGDGFQAPFAAYAISGVTLTGDAGGGSASINCTLDNRYVSLVAYSTGAINQVSSADVDHRFRIVADGAPVLVSAGTIEAISADVSAATINRTWQPPPVLVPGSVPANLVHDWLNVLNDDYKMHAYIYLFDIRVRELTPTGPLLWSRGST